VRFRTLETRMINALVFPVTFAHNFSLPGQACKIGSQRLCYHRIGRVIITVTPPKAIGGNNSPCERLSQALFPRPDAGIPLYRAWTGRGVVKPVSRFFACRSWRTGR